MKPSAAEKGLALLGLLLAAWGLNSLARGPNLASREMAAQYQDGFCSTVQGLRSGSLLSLADSQELEKRWLRASAIAALDPLRLRATPAFVLKDDGRFWPGSSDVHPPGAMRVSGNGSDRVLKLIPLQGTPWTVPLRSQSAVRPDWSAVSGLVAYYDLGRIWVADVPGRKFQSLLQVPELELGGELRFSADGASLAFLGSDGKGWRAVDFFALKPR